MNNLPPCPWCLKPPHIENISPMEVMCATEGCPPFGAIVSAEKWGTMGGHYAEVAFIRQDEPIFVLQGHDVLALVPVYTWIDNAEKKKVPEEKINSAVKRAEEMQSWQRGEEARLPD